MFVVYKSDKLLKTYIRDTAAKILKLELNIWIRVNFNASYILTELFADKRWGFFLENQRSVI